MVDEPQATRAELPPGFAVHNDGPGREVLVDPHDGDTAHVFATREAAAAAAWEWQDSICAQEAEDADAG